MTKTVLIISGFPNPPPDNSKLMEFLRQQKWKVVIKRVWEKIDIKPDVIIGISIGGLLATQLAQKHPRAKLILIGSGYKLSTSIPIYNWLIQLEAKDKKMFLVKLSKKVPPSLFNILYRLFNWSREISGEEYERRAQETFNGFIKTSTHDLKQLIKFATTTDNLKILPSLNNQTMIIAGEKDNFMPLSHSKLLNGHIKNSQLLINSGLHYDGIGVNEIMELNKFLR